MSAHEIILDPAKRLEVVQGYFMWKNFSYMTDM